MIVRCAGWPESNDDDDLKQMYDKKFDTSAEHSGNTPLRPLVDDAIVLTGPTASGKSSVAIELARITGAEILSLDSIAVYRGMDIGTAKPTPSERDLVVHHLVDLVAPNEEYSVACYLQAAHRAIADIESRGRQAIFVGGTPMFLKGVLRGFDPGPPADWEFRNAVEEDVQRHGTEALHQRLRQVDPLAAHRIAPTDSRRMIRALEVARQTGTPISHRQTQFECVKSADSCNVFALQWDRKQLHERINQRVEQMFEAGLVEEVKHLLENHGQLSRTASQAVGYREVIEFISGQGELSTVRQEVAAHTRQLARRQETWFRSFGEIRSVPVQEPLDAAKVAQQIREQLVSL